MPIYEYQCASCGHRFDYFARSTADRGPATCPQCGSSELTRLLSLFSARGSQAAGDDLCPR